MTTITEPASPAGRRTPPDTERRGAERWPDPTAADVPAWLPIWPEEPTVVEARRLRALTRRGLPLADAALFLTAHDGAEIDRQADAVARMIFGSPTGAPDSHPQPREGTPAR